jgi:hypothetical protein
MDELRSYNQVLGAFLFVSFIVRQDYARARPAAPF